MCRHIKNVQVSIRAPCCKRWFDCAECHAEKTDHELEKKIEITFACKKCKKCFRKDMSDFEQSDEYCPHCDNHFYITAETEEDKVMGGIDVSAETLDHRIKTRDAEEAAALASVRGVGALSSMRMRMLEDPELLDMIDMDDDGDW